MIKKYNPVLNRKDNKQIDETIAAPGGEVNQ